MAKIEQIQNSEVTKKFLCEIELNEIKERAEKELLKIAETAEIKGFRKGHAPLKVIKELYSGKAYNNAADFLIRETITKIGTENDYKLSSSPSVKMKEDEKEKVVFEVTFNLNPNVPSDFDFSKITAKTYETEINEEDLNKEIELIAAKNKTFALKEGKAEKGDVVVIDSIGRIDGIEFAGGKLDGHELELGSGAFIPGFEDQLIGTSADESVIVTVTFPEEYHAKDLAGKEAQFFTKVKEVKKGEQAKIDDELAKKLSFESIDELRKAVKDRIESFYQNAHKENLKEEIFNSVSENLEFAIPEDLVEKVAIGITEEKKLPKEEAINFKEEATKRLRLSFFLNHIANKEKITVSDQDFTNFIIQNSQGTGMNPFTMLEFYSKNKDARRKLELLIEENKIYDFIFAKINLEKEKISREKFDEILKIEK